MKWLARIFVFVCALFLGASAVWLLSSDDALVGVNPVSVGDVECGPVTPESPTGIKIMYAGWERGRADQPYLKFIIANDLDHPISYLGYGPKESPVDVTINGYSERRWECQNGTEFFTIPAGCVAQLYVGRHEFDERPRKNDIIAIEYSFWATPNGESEVHTSEPFILPAEFRESIKPFQF